MKYKILSTITSVILIISLFGCQQNNAIIKPDVDMKTVTQNSLDDLVSFTFDSPDNWSAIAVNKNSLICSSPSSNQSEENVDTVSPYYAIITNYNTYDIFPLSDEYKQSYKDLFKGKYDGVEKIINENIGYINISKVMDSFPDIEFKTPESIMDYFNILTEEPTVPNSKLSEYFYSKVWASDFKYTKYQCKNSNIIAVEYSYIILDKTYKAINCYRDDDYSVYGAFDNDIELSSGDVSLWIASTMEVAEHYRLEDGVVLREGKDY